MKRSKLLILICILASTLALLLAIVGALKREDLLPTEPAESTGPSSTAGTSSPSSQPSQTTQQPTDTSTSVTTEPIPSDALPPTQTTAPTQTQPAPTETEPTETEPTPTQTTPPTTQTQPLPTNPVGTGLYTMDQLLTMSTEKIGYGPGRTSGGVRAPYAVSAQKKYGKYGASFIGQDINCIYLTFDCGYEYTAVDENGNSYRVTEKILDVLKEKNVKAVFFVTLPYAQKNPDLVQRMIDEGHTVGSHSATHPVMPDITVEQMIQEITTVHQYVLDRYGYQMTLFRPPTGAYSVQSLCTAQTLGYENVFWSFAYADYNTANQPDLQEAYDLITRSHHNGAIYLLHAVSTTNAAVLGDVIDFMHAQGYSIELYS